MCKKLQFRREERMLCSADDGVCERRKNIGNTQFKNITKIFYTFSLNLNYHYSFSLINVPSRPKETCHCCIAGSIDIEPEIFSKLKMSCSAN